VLKLFLTQNLEPQVEVSSGDLRFHIFHVNTYFPLTNFNGNNQEKFDMKSAVQKIKARNKHNIHKASVAFVEE
jgi:hypothetical protein